MSGRDLKRRDVLAGAAIGAAGLLLPGEAFAQRRRREPPMILGGFSHGVASGEPSQTSMLFWTRYQSTGDRVAPLSLEISTDPRMARARKVAETYADPSRDWTARVTVNELEPGRTYYYRFIGPEPNIRSEIGRTKTLPVGSPPVFRMGVFSCSNLPFGWFNAYAHAVAADDIDLAVHLGDYIYEYPRGTYPESPLDGRLIEPEWEITRREDYWARYRSYRADEDLRALHARVPWIVMWDDHESANDSWENGAENHQPGEGDWAVRKAAAKAAFRDWLPVSDNDWGQYEIGRLATLYKLDTRLAGREKPLDLGVAIKAGPDVMTALARLRDDEWMAGNRQLLGASQEKWLFGEMQAAQRSGVRWQILAQQVVMGRINAPQGVSQMAGAVDGAVAARLGAAEIAARAGLPFNMDAWDGYPAARARLLSMAQRTGADLIVFAGDSHNAWANDLVIDGRPAGVEFAVQSVTSPGFESYLKGAQPAQLAAAIVGANPTLKWADTHNRGYMQVTLTPSEAVSEWRFTAPVGSRSAELSGVMRARTRAQARRLQLG